MRRKFALALAAPVLATALVGCGMLPGQLGGGEAEQSAESTGAAPEQSATAAQPEQVKAIASRNVSHNGSNLRVDITSLKRQGKVATLTWTVTNVSASQSGSGWYVGANLGTNVLDTTTAGVSLIDSVNAKRYRVARNGTGEDADCVCSKVNNHIKTGDSLEMYAVYGAPPAGVSKVNVEMADLGVFSDVPIS